MKRFGLVGNPLTHSWSEQFFTELFRKHRLSDYRYELFPKSDLADFRQWISHQEDLYGLNVTTPFKISVIPELDEIDPAANETGAVNTIRIARGRGKLWLKGFNTDVDGFSSSLPDPFLHKHALILGTGGASKAVTSVFKQLNISFLTVSRKYSDSGDLTYQEISKQVIEQATVIVNTTPLGMYPETHLYPLIPYQHISFRHLLIDLIYNPVQTLFLKSGKAHGAQTINGLRMLQIQAEKAFDIFISA